MPKVIRWRMLFGLQTVWSTRILDSNLEATFGAPAMLAENGRTHSQGDGEIDN